MKPEPTLQCGLHYSVDIWIKMYMEPVQLKRENLPQNIHGYTDIFTV